MERCKITNSKIHAFERNKKGFNYYVKMNEEKIHFDFCKTCYDKIDFEKYRSVILRAC